MYEPKAAEPEVKVPFLVRVGVPDLNIRTGPGVDHPRTGKFTGVGTFTIVEVKDGKGSSEGWGRLKSGAGWIDRAVAGEESLIWFKGEPAVV